MGLSHAEWVSQYAEERRLLAPKYRVETLLGDLDDIDDATLDAMHDEIIAIIGVEPAKDAAPRYNSMK